MGGRASSWGVVGRVLWFPVAVLAVIAIQSRVEVGVLTVDPVTQGALPPYAGLISTAGILLWCMAAACGIFAGTFRGAHRTERRAACAVAFGLLCAWLCVDDAFLIHDAVGPRILGIPELAVIGSEALWLAVLLVRFRDVLRCEEPVLFATAIVCFGASVVSDAIPTNTSIPGLWRLATYTVEDGFKWVGIFVLSTWLVRLSRRVLAPALQSSLGSANPAS